MHYAMSFCIVLNSWELFDWFVELECKSVFHSTEQKHCGDENCIGLRHLT